MLFAGWEVRMVKNCDLGPENAALGRTVTKGLKMLPEAAGRGQHFQARGHSFSPYGPTLSRQITCLFFSALNWFN